MVLNDEILGDIKLVPSIKARRIIVRYREGQFVLTHPVYADLSIIKSALERMKPKLIELKETKLDKIIFTPQTKLKTTSFDLSIVISNTISNWYVSLKNNLLLISCPSTTVFESADVQAQIKNYIEQALRIEAKRIFPQKVASLALQHGFEFKEVKINKSRTRWGSCSGKKSINLSYYCMLLPEHLIDFIILHELCHTKEMNHGEKFWALLDSVSSGQAKSLTRELKSTKVHW